MKKVVEKQVLSYGAQLKKEINEDRINLWEEAF